MKGRYGSVQTWIGCLAILVLILDGKLATKAAADGVQLCLQVLIPSLFPFLVFSPLLRGGVFDLLLQPLCRILRISRDCTPLLLSSILGGYPVGAATTGLYFRQEMISSQDARRFMTFCNNPGPAFLFGIGIHIFQDVKYCWLAWLIILCTSAFVAIATPGTCSCLSSKQATQISLPGSMTQAVKVMATICGWVVIFRILIEVLNAWIIWRFPEWIGLTVSGLLELSNGCSGLIQQDLMGAKLLLFTAFMSFGGICVWLQTISVTHGIDTRLYIPGKITQTACSILLSTAAQFLLPKEQRLILPISVLCMCLAICILYTIILKNQENSCRNLQAIGV